MDNIALDFMRGIPGSGKTTWVQENAKGARVISADHYFTDPETQVYKWDPRLLGEAQGQSLRLFIESLMVAVEEGFGHIVVDNTNLKVLDLNPYVALANAYGFTPRIITIHVDPVIAYNRGKHGVPFSTVQRMAATMAAEVLPSFWKVKVEHVGMAHAVLASQGAGVHRPRFHEAKDPGAVDRKLTYPARI